MSYNFLPYDQGQSFLLPPSLEEWLPEGHLARFVSDVVDRFDAEGVLRPFYARYREDGWGAAAYHPAMLVKVLLYGYSVGVTSSRKLAASLKEVIAFRYLAANQYPDFRTISDFRKDHLPALEGLFQRILDLCKEAGLVKMGTVALDAKSVKANASYQQNRNQDEIKALVKRLLEEAERIDSEEDEQFGPDQQGDEWPDGWSTREDRLKRIDEALRRLKEQEQQVRTDQDQKLKAAEKRRKAGNLRGTKPLTSDEMVQRKMAKAKANLTDPDSRILKTPTGYLQGYKAHAMVDASSQIIVAYDVSRAANERNELVHMLNRCRELAGAYPKASVQDAGYWNQDEHQKATNEKLPTELFTTTMKNATQRQVLKEQPPPRGRIPTDATIKQRMERKLRTLRGRRMYRLRSSTAEPVFGQFTMRSLLNFWLRGQTKVRAEWSLWSSTHNLLKLWRHGVRHLSLTT